MFTRTGVEGLLGLLVKWVHNNSCWSRQRFTRTGVVGLLGCLVEKVHNNS